MTLVQALGSDGSLVLPPATALAQGDPSAKVDLAFAKACLQAGAAQPCETFLASLAAPRRQRVRVFLKLQMGDPAPAFALVRATDTPAEVRLLLNLELARRDLHSRDDTLLRRARAAVNAAEALDTDQLYTARIALAHAQCDVAGQDYAMALTRMRQLLASDTVLDGDVREALIVLNQRLINQASDLDHDATDQARKVMAEMNRQSADDALRSADELVKRFPASSLAWLALGLARLKSADEPGAVLAFEKAKFVCPYDPDPDLQLANLHERRGRHARALYYLERGVESAPLWPKGLWQLVDVAMLAREPNQADAALVVLKRLFPSEITVDLGHARVLLERDDGVRALAVLKEAARAHPLDVRPPLALGKAALALFQRAGTQEVRARMQLQAKDALAQARAIDKDSGEVNALATEIDKLKQ